MCILIATSTFPLTADEGLPRFVYELAGNMCLRSRMGGKAREQVRERFDFRRRCQEWEDLIVRLSSAR
jgi:hypothetical protein